MSICPSGHPSASTDYCDVCGLPMDAAPAASGSTGPGGPGGGSFSDGGSALGAAAASGLTPAAPVTQACPNCAEANPPDALFCESCGYDFTTGTMPRPVSPLDLGTAPPTPPAPAPSVGEWVVERWIDPDWYALQQSDDPCPSPGLPIVVPLLEKSLLIGRPSKSRGITPQIDCDGDTGVSRRQAQLTTDGQRWWVEDLQSANGTYVGAAAGPMPTDPITPGQRRELGPDDRIYVGAWTRLVVRRSTPEEQSAQA
ncbi:FHA domain-containing protein [Kribbella deserti]|uniref:FHA domain-containing protein n=1 Tax=Kribbella deserti TaxID=1926257 RepID=A0ABV6QW70_9ACTN